MQSYQFTFVSFLKFIDGGFKQYGFTTALLAYDNNIFVVLEPSSYDLYILFNLFGQINFFQSFFIFVFIFSDFTVFLSQTQWIPLAGGFFAVNFFKN